MLHDTGVMPVRAEKGHAVLCNDKDHFWYGRCNRRKNHGVAILCASTSPIYRRPSKLSVGYTSPKTSDWGVEPVLTSFTGERSFLPAER